jgi:integrase
MGSRLKRQNPEVISDILGHADITTTKRIYAHWVDRTHKRTMQD